MYLYLNGSYVKSPEAAISPFDHGFLYGLGLFETFRTYDGHPFLLDDHFQRLHESAAEMGIVLPSYNREAVQDTIAQLLRRNRLTDGYFRWNVSAGEREIGFSATEYCEPNIIVFVKALPEMTVKEKRGLVLTQRRNTPEGALRLKSHHFFNNIIGKREAGSDPSVEGIFLTADDFVAEGVVSNIFWVKRNTLFTPSPASGALNGITRQFVMLLAKRCGYEVKVGLFDKNQLLDAEEAFITNSIQELTPLSDIDGLSYAGKNGPVVRALQTAYRNCTAASLWSRFDLLKGDLME
ncbi:4-amino-4-deoxychorismate lyase [Evansella caseinilytica]|uniref:4-amino-4-deoxychorismate lyase n=1 Tax=Evansella caseinilytica TaxID=1503961 RepID=A0A1H3UUX7_9BACI|nr:aminodeoxychorismate lyase [Evansella caseinilytica]SDZ66222.1 4-amino-4-deoxychorismate lyase [Evansella caseinilytica]